MLENQLSLLIREYLPHFNAQLSETVYSWEPEVFLQRLESYRLQAAAQPLLDEQKEEVEYVIRYYAADYQARYGVDPKAQQAALEKLAAATQLGKAAPKELAQNISEIWGQVYVRKLSSEDFLRLDSIAWKGFDINKGSLYRVSPEYRKMVDMALKRAAFQKPVGVQQPQRQQENEIDRVLEEISDPYIREALVYRNVKTLLQKRSLEAERYYRVYEHMAKDATQLSEIKEIYDRLQRYSPGHPAPDFTYLDTKDTPVSLSQLRGDYVYIEVWATWCGPCQEQLPHFTNLAKAYEGAGVKFIGLSVDKDKARGKWVDYVRNSGLQGLQVIADDGLSSPFLRELNIARIPWAILIDPDGNMVSDNAPKPSDPSLRLFLNNLLEQAHG